MRSYLPKRYINENSYKKKIYQYRGLFISFSRKDRERESTTGTCHITRTAKDIGIRLLSDPKERKNEDRIIRVCRTAGKLESSTSMEADAVDQKHQGIERPVFQVSIHLPLLRIKAERET